MVALEVLSLAVNRVSTLRDVENCKNLKELYMRKNNLSNIAEVPTYLRGLFNLRKLSLYENPIADLPRYRQYVVKALPQIEQLDNVEVTHEERMKVAHLSLEELCSDKLSGAAGLGGY